MISASSMISGKTHPPPPPGHGIVKNGLPQPHHVQPHVHGIENRLRMDSQKFLVPSLPPSSGRHEVIGGMSLKRKERITHNVNGSSPLETNYPMTNGGRRYNNGGQPTHPTPQQQSPRSRDQSHSSPMYNDIFHPSHHALLTSHHQMPTNPANYHPSRSSVPIPCSSPAPASSASPKAMSPSTNTNSGPNQNARSSVYSPQLPGGHGELNLSSRLYSHPPNGYLHPHHPNLGLQNHPAAFFAAAAAAAATGSHYPLFSGGPYTPHSHSAAASSYLDTFHSNILAQQQQQQQQQLKLGVGQSGTTVGLGLPTSAASYLPPHLRLSYHPHGTSTTSLHTKLIDSTGERYSGHGHAHLHGGLPTSREYNGISGVHYNGLSKGGPLGISPLDLPLTHAPSHQPPRKNISQGGKESGTKVNPTKHQWNERDHLTISQPLYPKTSPTNGVSISAYEYRHGNEDQKLLPPPPAHSGREKTTYKQRITNFTTIDVTEDPIPSKMPKPNNSLNVFTFPGDIPSPLIHGGRNGRPPNGFYYDLENGVKESCESESMDLNTRNFPIGPLHISHQPQFQPPGSPKRRKVGGSGGLQWSCVIPPPKISPHQTPMTMSDKYLNHQLQKTLKPDSSVPSSPSSLHKSSPGGNICVPAQSPSSKVPKSPTVAFKLTPKVPPSPKKILQTHNENHLNSRSLLLPPLPIEEMPLLDAFRRGSLIQLATGEIKSVENLCGEDFAHSAAMVADSMKIVYCTVLAIEEMDHPSTPSQPAFGKVTLGMESHKQQVVLESTLEQPFFTVGSGWSSLCPESTKRLLQLTCSSLRVGDICMTLTRTPGKSHSSGTASILRSGTSKPRNYSILSSPKANIVTAKGSKPNNIITTGSTMKKQLGTKPTTIANDISQATAMLPPPSPHLSSIADMTMTQTQGSDESTSSSGLSSPKKRRWSAPEPEANDEVAQTKSAMKSQQMEEKGRRE